MTRRIRHNEDAPASPAGTALLTKALDVIDRIAATGARPKVADIAAATGYARPTLYRILAALSARGMIRQDPRDHAYTLGPRFTELAAAVARHTELIALADPALRAVAETHGEAVNLGLMVGTAQQTIARWPGFGDDGPAAVGALKPLHCTALGKALLAAHPDGSLAEHLALEPLTPATLTVPTALAADLALTRARGFALDDGEIIEGVACVAVAVPGRGSDAPPVAAISVSGPAHRMGDARRRDIAADIARAARAVSTALLERADPDPAAPGAEPVRAFAVRALWEEAEGYAALDGPGGRVLRVRGGAAACTHRIGSPIDAAARVEGALMLLAGGALLRADPDGGTPIPVATGLPEGADALLALAGGALLVGAGALVLRLEGGRWEAVADDRAPHGALCLLGGMPWYGTANGLSELRGSSRVALGAAPVAVAALPDGRVAAATDEPWSLLLAGDGPAERLPLPVPRPTALLSTDDALLVGSDRVGLSASEIALAPLSGGVLRLPLPLTAPGGGGT